MIKRKKRQSDRAQRRALPSPGRPPVVHRAERRRFWIAVAAGQSSEVAARTEGVCLGSVYDGSGRWWYASSQLAMSAPTRSARYLSMTEREELALLRAKEHGVRESARRMKRALSRISSELRRNAATRSGGFEYRATIAQWHADRASRRPKVARPAIHDALRCYVMERRSGSVVAPSGQSIPGPDVRWKSRRHGPRQHRRWALAWRPEQNAHRLPVDFPDDPTMRISHEAIYQALYVQGRGALRREQTACLRTGRALRVPRAPHGRGKGFVTPDVLISGRPPHVGDRAIPGHREGDLILGLQSSAIGTLVERTTRFTMLLHLPPMPGRDGGRQEKNGPALAGHGAEAVRDAITSAIAGLPEQLRRSLTWDQGTEMSQHVRLRIDSGAADLFL